MANFQDVLNGLTTINGKVATSLTDMRKNIANFVGDGFVELGDLTYANGQISLSNAQVLVKGARLNVTLSSTISNNQSCYIRVASDFTFALQVFSNISTTDGLLTVTTPDFNSAYTYIKVAEIYNSALHDCRSLLIKANSLANSLYHAQIATSSWILNQGLYEFVITHNMGTKHLYVSMVSTSDNSSMVFAYDILNDNQIKVYSDTNIASEVCIISKSNQYNVTNDFIDDTNIATTKTLSSNEIVKRLNEIKNANSTFTNIVSDNLAVEDLNTVTKNGYFYTSPSTLNLPTELTNNVDKYCILLNIIEYDKEGYQLLIPISGGWINSLFKRVIYDQGNSRTEWTYALDSSSWSAELQTTNKTIIGAINEVFQLGNNVKRNLVDALVARGVSCSTSDSFDSLIDNVANMQTSPLDITSATSLPSTGKDKQICIVTDNPVNNFIVSSNFNDKSTDTSKITLYLGNTASNDATEGTLLSIPSGNITTNYYFAKACQGEARLASYYWSNNKWNELTKRYVYFLENKALSNVVYFGGLYLVDDGAVTINKDKGISFTSSYYDENTYIFTSRNKINFNLYSKIDITGFASNGDNFVSLGITDTQFNKCIIGYINESNNFKQYVNYQKFGGGPATLTYNISSITGEGYLGFQVQIPDYTTITITDIRLY